MRELEKLMIMKTGGEKMFNKIFTRGGDDKIKEIEKWDISPLDFFPKFPSNY